MAETRKETSNADTSSVVPIPPKPVLKFKPPKTKLKIGAPVARANSDVNQELEALLESKPAPTKNTAANTDLLLGELVDEIGVDTKPRGMPSWSSKRKGKDRADGQTHRLVPDSTSRQGSPAVPGRV